MRRLLAEPMNVPLFMLPMMNVYCTIKRINVGARIVRRIVEVNECTGVDVDRGVATFRNVFRYNPVLDEIEFREESYLLRKLAEEKFKEYDEILEELDRREEIIRYLAEKGKTDYAAISAVVREYYYNPTRVYNAVKMGEL